MKKLAKLGITSQDIEKFSSATNINEVIVKAQVTFQMLN